MRQSLILLLPASICKSKMRHPWLIVKDKTGLSAIFVTMKVVTKTAFQPSIEIDLPLSKSEGIRVLISRYIVLRGRGATVMPSKDLLGADAPEDLHTIYDGLQALLSGQSDIRLTASASVARFLLVLAAADPHRTVFHLTDPQLRRRPMGPLIDNLRSCGVKIDMTDDRWIVDARRSSVPRETEIDARAWESSQFVSAIIYFAVLQNYPMTIRRQLSDPSSKYIALTITSLRQIGVDLTWEADWISFDPRTRSGLKPIESCDFSLPADYTSASYWLELQTLHPEIQILTLHGLNPGSLHPDARLFRFFSPFLVFDEVMRVSRRRELFPDQPLFFDLSQNPDLFPTLFATVIGLGIETTFTGLSSLAYKESDRLSASLSIAQDLGWSADAFVNVTPNGFTYTGVPRETEPEHVTLNHRGDHRLAMAFGVLATALDETHVEIPDDRAVTSRSYPHFFTDLCRQAK